MYPIKNIKELNNAIILLEKKQTEEVCLLKEQYNKTYESLKPINLIKSTLKELVTAPDLKEDLLNASIGMATGYLSKKIAIGSTDNPIKQMLGSFLQMGVTSVVTKNADTIRTKFMEMINSDAE